MKNNEKDQTKKTILLIEDDEVSHLLLKEYLKKFNLSLIHQTMGKSGLRSFELYRDIIKLVLVDIRLPDIDGICIHDEIRKINSSVPIVALTALSLEIRNKCLETGFDAVLQKPLDFYEFDKIIEKYLGISPD